MNCPKCGTSNETGALFCKQCGASMTATAAGAPQAPKSFCRNCGKELMGTPEICLSCGAKPLAGKSFCPVCGAPTNALAEICIKCGAKLSGATGAKSKLAAGLLGIFLGELGIHRFYLGYVGLGIVQIVVTIITFGIGGLWGFIEGILILTGTFNKDAKGQPLKD